MAKKLAPRQVVVWAGLAPAAISRQRQQQQQRGRARDSLGGQQAAARRLAVGKSRPDGAAFHLCACLLVFVLVVALEPPFACRGVARAQAEPRQSQQQQQPQLQELATSGSGAQWFYAAAPAAGLQLANTKRARKMSAFMPMRGRRAPQPAAQFGLEAAAASVPLVWLSIESQPEHEEQEQEQELGGGGLAGPMQAGRPSGGLLPLQPSAFVLSHLQQSKMQQAREQQGPELTGAKLRRAFHPMRGKRVGGELVEAAQQEDIEEA